MTSHAIPTASPDDDILGYMRNRKRDTVTAALSLIL